MASKSKTPGFGGEFEILVPAYFALLLNNNPEVKYFTIRSNASKEFGNLDDVVIDIFLKNGKQINFAIQLKTHTNRYLQQNGLEADSGKFSLQKYCKSFKKIEKVHKDYYFILFTDAEFCKEQPGENKEKEKQNEEKKKENKKNKKETLPKFEIGIDHYTVEDTQDAQQNIFNKILRDFNTSTENDKKNIYTFKVIKENNVQNNENATTSKENNVQSNAINAQNNEETLNGGAINAENNEGPPTNAAINVQNNEETPTSGATNAENKEENPANDAIIAQNSEETPTDGAINAQNDEETLTDGAINAQNNEETPNSGAINAENNEGTPTNAAINVQNNEETSTSSTNAENKEENPANDATSAQNNEETSTEGAINAQNNEETPTDGATNAQNNEEAVTKEDLERFFSRLFLFVCQQNFRNFKQRILDIFKYETISLNYEKLFRDWHQGDFTNKKIDKRTLNSHLINFFLLSPNPLIRSSRLSFDGNTNLGMFNQIAKKFDLSVVNSSFNAFEVGLGKPEANFSLQRIRDRLIKYMKEHKIDVQGLENDPQGEKCLLRLAKEWKFVDRWTNGLDNETRLKILQYFFEEPVILEFSDESSKKLVYLMLNLYKMEDNRIKFILLGQDFDSRRFPDLSVFKNLAHLDVNSDFFEKIVQRCQISIQGRTVTMKDFIDRHPEVIEWVEAIDIFEMLKGDYRVGVEEIKNLPIGTSNIKSKSSRIFENIPKGSIKAVCTETGMGKSVMLQHLKNICPRFYWIRGYTFHYYKPISDVDEFLNSSLKLLGKGKNIENFYLKKKQVAIFFDELDAVSSSNLNSVFDYINKLSEREYIVFVAARKCILTKIVNRFGNSVEIINIEKLTKNEQEEYIRGNVSTDEDFINNFLQHEDPYFEIPLFLTSVNLLEQLRPHPVTSCSMYFKVLHQHLVKKIEAEVSHPDSLIADTKIYHIYGDIDMLQPYYEFPALQFLFGDKIFDKLKIQDKRLFQNYLSSVSKYNDPLGILNLDDNGKIVFEYASLAEYLAGNYFANNSDKFQLLIENRLGDDKIILKQTYDRIQGKEKAGNGCHVALSA